jgi:hypothetical protein
MKWMHPIFRNGAGNITPNRVRAKRGKMKQWEMRASIVVASHCYVVWGSNCFQISGFSLNRDHNRPDSRTWRKKPSWSRARSERSSEMHGVPAADFATRKRTVSFSRRTLTWGCKVRTKSEIRRSRAHVCTSHTGDIHASTVRIQFIYISPSADISWNGVYLDSTEVFPVDAFHTPYSHPAYLPRFFFLHSPVLFYSQLERNHRPPVECTLSVRIAHVRDKDFRG